MKHLLNISIGPVQEFIASARRCQDLWYGSWLLSELSKTAAQHLKDHRATSVSVIFPGGLAGASILDKEASVANKILATVEGEAAQVTTLAQGAQEAMMAHLKELAGPVFSRSYGRLTGEDVKEAATMAWEQVLDLMEFQWVAVSFQDEAGYAGARQEAERLLAAVKNTKPWGQPSWARAGWRKSSLDGVRESVIPERFFENRQESEAERAEWLYRQFRVKPAERLCGIGLLKRWGKDVPAEGEEQEAADRKPRSFHSTSHMAAGPLRSRAAMLATDPKVAAAWQAYETCLRRAPFSGHNRVQWLAHPLFGDYDGSVLYPSRVRDTFFAGSDVRKASGPYAQACEEAECALGRLLDALGVAEPNPHYALLLADGDRMGKAIDALSSPATHQAISMALDDFAKGVKGIVQAHGGSYIYSGGDDVLAILPLHTCLDCAEKLAQDFAERLKSFKPGNEPAPTLSVGIAIAHHLEDFADVRAWAKQAEALAKRERNSLAIRLEKRGGSPVEACGTWDGPFLARLRDWIELHRAGEVPNKLPFQWAELVRMARGSRELDELVMSDARRLLARKDIAKAGMKDVKSLKETLNQMTDPTGLEALSAELVLAKEIERAQDQAMTPVPAKEVV